jgi:hypothetical protein
VNVSSPSVALTARAIDGEVIVGGAFTFTRRTASYSYTVNTGGLSRGPHTLQFTAGSDPLVHSVPFQVR